MPDAAIEFTLSGWTRRIEPWCPGVFRFRAKLETVAWEESGIFLLPESGDATGFENYGADARRGIRGPGAWVELELDDHSLSWGIEPGQTLGKLPGASLACRPKTVDRWVPGETGEKTSLTETIDGQKALDRELMPVRDREAWTVRIGLSFAEDEALFGLGGLEEGHFNYRGQCQYLYPHNLRLPIPHLISSHGYSLLVHTGSGMRFDDTGGSPFLEIDTADQVDFFILLGPNFDRLVAHFRRLTGRAAPLPDWALGYIQSKEHYQSQEELLAVAREYRRRDVPLAVLVQDWKYWPEGQWGQKSFDPERYPDPAGLVRELHEQSVRLMISLWPNVAPDCPDHRQSKAAGALLADGSTYDAFSPEARKLFWAQVQRELGSSGIDAWWCDSSEPFNPDWQGSQRPSREEGYRQNLDNAARYLDPTRAAAYGLEHARTIFEGMQRDRPNDRVLNLTRSAWPGQQQFGAVPWSGDISARWDIFRKQIAEGLSFCATGMPYWTMDIGGFFTGRGECFHRWTGQPSDEKPWFWEGDYEDGCSDLGYRELYVRWFQAGVFLPLFRAHGTDTPREIWRFGEPGEIFYDALVDAIELRGHFLPYFKKIIREIEESHGSWLRMLAFDFRKDRQVLEISDQFMCGRDVMVCPVTEPFLFRAGSRPVANESVMGREVYFPAGAEWTCFWSGIKITGGKRAWVEAPIDRIPLYLRDGATLPS